MFEQSLISDKMAKAPRRKAYLSVALVVHVAGFLAMLFFQYWTVDALPEPPVQVSFFTALTAPPPPPPPAPKPVVESPRPPAAPVALAQPTVVPDAPPQPSDQTRVILTDVLPTTDAEPSSGDGVPGPPGDGPPAPPSDPGILVVGGAVQKPVAIFQPQPTYTEMARRTRTQGVVILEAIIDREGNVTDVKLRAGLPYGLSEEAIKAVRKWKFRPSTLDGKPVAVFYNLTVRFTLQ